MQDEIEWLVETYRGLLGRMAPEQIRAHLMRGRPANVVDEVVKRVTAEIERIRNLVPPPTMKGDNGATGWYLGPDAHSRYWNAYRTLLRQKGWEDANIRDLDNASTKIVSLLDHPGTGAFNRRGLVLG